MIYPKTKIGKHHRGAFHSTNRMHSRLVTINNKIPYQTRRNMWKPSLYVTSSTTHDTTQRCQQKPDSRVSNSDEPSMAAQQPSLYSIPQKKTKSRQHRSSSAPLRFSPPSRQWQIFLFSTTPHRIPDAQRGCQAGRHPPPPPPPVGARPSLPHISSV